MKILAALACAVLMSGSAPAAAQQPVPSAQTASPKAPPPDLAILKAMKSRLFIIQHRDPSQIVQVLHPMRSGAEGSMLSWTNRDGLNTLSARDFPENLAAIEDALKRLDVPATVQKATDIELTLHVLFASKGPAPDAGLPSELLEVVKQLKGTLAYRGYALAASFIQRVQVQDNAASYPSGMGYVLPGALAGPEGKETPRMKVEWRAQGLKLGGLGEGPLTLDIGAFRFDLEEETATRSGTLAKFNTPLSLREGERVVVGTSVVKDHGVVVVLTAQRIKR